MSTHTRTRVSALVKAANGETGQAHGPGLTTTIAPARAPWWHYTLGFAFGGRPMRGTIQAVDPAEARALSLVTYHQHQEAFTAWLLAGCPSPQEVSA
jgi:hypothetical protein